MSIKSVITAIALVGLSFFGCTEDEEGGTGPAAIELSAKVTAPTDGSVATDLVDITVEAVDDKGIAKVEFFVDAMKLGEDAVAPYKFLWNTTGLQDGSVHSIFAVAFDTDGNKFGTETIITTIDTSLSSPQTAVLNSPASITDSSVTLTWSQNTDNDFSRYLISWDTSAVAPLQLGSMIVTSQMNTSLAVMNLRDNALYHFQVTTFDIFGRISASALVEARTVNVAPPKPFLISVTRKAGNLTCRWIGSGIFDFLKYEIVRSSDTILDGGDPIIATVTDINTIQAIIPFADTTTFTFFLIVHDNLGLSSASAGVLSNSVSPNFALQFDGSQYATVPYFSALDVGGKYTLESWVNMTSTVGFMRVIDKGPPSTSSPFLQYSLICDPNPGADICNGTTSPARFHSTGAVPLNEWHHIALTYNEGLIIYYIDGVVVDTSLTTIMQTCGFSTTLNIGRRKMFNEFYFRGMIDEVRIWNVVRTPTEILSAFSARLTGSEPGLVCYYDFDEGAGDIIGSPVGGAGHLGDVPGADTRDPLWVTSTAPISN